MNLKELRFEILKDNSDPIANTEMNGWINRALDDLSMIARYTKSIYIPMTSGATDYVLPADFLEVDAMSCHLSRLPLNDFHSEGYKLIGSTLKFQNTRIKGNIELIYIASLPHLASDTDIPAIPTPFHDLLVLFSVSKAKFKDELDDMQRVALREYNLRKEDFIRYINRTRSVPRPIKNVYGGGFNE